MELPDVNVLVYAFRADAPHHDRYRRWLDEVVNSVRPFGVSSLVMSGFLRVVTHPRIFRPPTPLAAALGFVAALRACPTAVLVEPGARHFSLFVDLCRSVGARGNLVPDAYLAALAIETGSEWITTDRDFSRFPGLKWRHPLDRSASAR